MWWHLTPSLISWFKCMLQWCMFLGEISKSQIFIVVVTVDENKLKMWIANRKPGIKVKY